MKVRRETWTGNDDLVEIDNVSFDATDILGSVKTDSLPAPSDLDNYGDWIFETAIDAGLADPYDGPYTVLDTPDYELYYENRKKGIIDPDISHYKHRITELTLKNNENRLKELKESIAKLESEIADEKKELGYE